MKQQVNRAQDGQMTHFSDSRIVHFLFRYFNPRSIRKGSAYRDLETCTPIHNTNQGTSSCTDPATHQNRAHNAVGHTSLECLDNFGVLAQECKFIGTVLSVITLLV